MPPRVSSPRSRLPLVLGLLAFMALALRLGVWQLDRLSDRQAANAAAQARRELPTIELTSGTAAADEVDGRRAVARGVYDRSREIVLRGQAYAGVPGVVLVTPLHLRAAGDTVLLVERGFVPSPDAISVPTDPPLDEPGEQEVRGLAFAIPAGRGAPLDRHGRLTLQRLDRAVLRHRLPFPVLPVYLRQLPDSGLPSFPRRRPAPSLDEGPHRLYAIQWFAFAAIAAVFAGVFWKRADRSSDRREVR